MSAQISVGDRVACGTGADRDTGIVHEIRGDVAIVGWDGGVTTPCDLADLELTDERWSGGVRCDEVAS